MIKSIAPDRKPDDYGKGHFGASRGKRKHNGKDYAVWPNSKIFSPVEGEITKIGYPYGDDLAFRYVQITINSGFSVRIFYIEPVVSVGDFVTKETIIGSSQSLLKRYKNGMTPHIHLEVKNLQGEFIDPKELGL